MIHWLITAVLVAISYFIGRRHGWKAMDRYYSSVLDKIAQKLGVRLNDSCLTGPDEDWAKIISQLRASGNDISRN